MDGQQLVARIKRSSKYWEQTAPNQWFAVRVVDDASYRLRGNGNNYRLSDVALGARLDDGSIVDLTSGKRVTWRDNKGREYDAGMNPVDDAEFGAEP